MYHFLLCLKNKEKKYLAGAIFLCYLIFRIVRVLLESSWREFFFYSPVFAISISYFPLILKTCTFFLLRILLGTKILSWLTNYRLFQIFLLLFDRNKTSLLANQLQIISDFSSTFWQVSQSNATHQRIHYLFKYHIFIGYSIKAHDKCMAC